SSQRAAVAAEMLPFLEAEAKKRQKAAGGDRKSKRTKGDGSLPQKVAEPIQEAREQAARATGTNRLYVSHAKRLKEQAPDLFEQVKQGKINIYEARSEVRKRDKHVELEAKAAENLAVGGLVDVEYRGSWSNCHFETLSDEVRSRPDFAARQAEAEQFS